MRYLFWKIIWFISLQRDYRINPRNIFQIWLRIRLLKTCFLQCSMVWEMLLALLFESNMRSSMALQMVTTYGKLLKIFSKSFEADWNRCNREGPMKPLMRSWSLSQLFLLWQEAIRRRIFSFKYFFSRIQI